jgi:hypothetical protein
MCNVMYYTDILSETTKQGSPHHWKFSNLHTGLRFGHSFPFVYIRLYNKIVQATSRSHTKYAAGPCQRSLSRVRVPWDSRPYFTVSDLRLRFSSSPTTRRVTVDVFDPASTRVNSRPDILHAIVQI